MGGKDKDPSSLEQRISEEMLGVEVEADDPSVLIDVPFDPDKIKVSNEKKTVDLLIRRIDNKEVDLAPEFQRRARLWHPHKKSQLIESLLLRIPLPVFYVAANSDDDWAVVDGLQRLTTMYDFVKSQFVLKGLEYLKQFENFKFSDLDRAMKRRIEETELVINVIQPGTPDEVMINIFKRINTGGVPLNGQEIRNALHPGPARQFLGLLATSEAFQAATDHSVRDDRMDAQEMVLRYMAFRTSDWRTYTSNNLDSFLNEMVLKINAMSLEERFNYAAEFERVMRTARQIFENDGFRKRLGPSDPRRPVSKALFEVWSVGLAVLSDEERATLVAEKSALRQGLTDLMKSDAEFFTSISYSTGTPKRVKKRFEAIDLLIANTLANAPP